MPPPIKGKSQWLGARKGEGRRRAALAKGKGEKGKAGGVKGKKKAKGKGKGKGKAVVAGAAGAVSKLISLRDSRRGNSMLRGPFIDFHRFSIDFQ